MLFVDDIFVGKLLVCLCCRRCNNIFCREEEFIDLLLVFLQVSELEGRIVFEQDENLLFGKYLIEYDEMIVNLILSFDWSFKGGDVIYSINVFGLILKFVEDGDVVVVVLLYSVVLVDSLLFFIIGLSLLVKLCELVLRIDVLYIFFIQLLEYFFEFEIFEGFNQYYCDQCNSLQDVE